MSTIQNQVKKKVFGRYKVDGFVSLVKSAGLLQKTFEILGFIERENENIREENKIKLVFGNATDIFNLHDAVDYYFFALRGKNGRTTMVCIQVNHPLMIFEELTKSKKQDNKLNFNIMKYYKGKGPPIN